MKTKSKIENQESQNETPKYYLADVPQKVRLRALDLCFRRLWHEALDLLHRHGFTDYTQDDLISFYGWAPKELAAQPVVEPRRTVRDYLQPAPEQIEEMRNRLAELTERVEHALKHESIERVANLLWKAGAAFSTAELYEYRKTLFPPNAMVDPYTAGPPKLHPESVTQASPSAGSSGVPPQSPPANEQLITDKDPPLPPPILDPPSSIVASHAPATSLLSDLRDLITRYIVLPELAAETLALWVVHTYVFTLREVTTYIGVVSPEKRCGKTTLLELLGRLANRPLTAANISPSALFRVIEENKPTLLIDEADTFLQGRDELGGILNAGYRKDNAYVVRLADGKKRRTKEPSGDSRASSLQFGDEFAQYSCWCPKVMAAIGRLPDTLADRCIVIAMQRKMPGEKCERMRRLDTTEYRKRCADFTAQHSDAIANARPEIPSTLNDRAADIWEPLLAIADLAGGEWSELARRAALKLSGAADDDMTLIGYFLKDIRTLMLNSNVDRILSRDIIRVLNPMHDRPWEDLRRGREINEWWLGHKMSELGIRARSLRYGESVGRGYVLKEIDAAFRRYVPSAESNSAGANEPGGVAQ